MLTAILCPAYAVSTFSPWTCSDLTLEASPEGMIWTSSPSDTDPLIAVPVRTVPKPDMWNALSTGIKNAPFRSLCFAERTIPSISDISSGMPLPVRAETGISGFPSRNVPAVKEYISSFANSSISSSTRSILFMTAMPFCIPRRVSISRCSLV